MDPQTLKTLQALADAIGTLQHKKDITGTPDAQLIFGPAGIFSNFGLDSTVINLSLSPRGIDRVLPVVPTVELYPIFPYITGFDPDEDAVEPNGVCDDAPGGVIETAHTTAQFGRFSRSTKEMEINQLMQILNGKLTTDLRLLGSVLGPGHALLSSEVAESGDWLTKVLNTQMVIVGVELQQLLGRKLWNGDPNNNSVGGGYMEFPGLELQIATGKVDCFTMAPVPALDPDVKDFGFNVVDDTDPDLVNTISMMAYFLQHKAERQGLEPVEWVIAMRPELWWEVSALWPCRYLTNRCQASQENFANGVVINDTNYVDMRDALRTGMYLPINGRNYPVITDDGISELNSTNSAELAAGEFASDIYMIPLRAKGMPVTYWEHLDYTAAMAEVSRIQGKQFWATDGGRYMWTLEQKSYCFKLQAKLEPRVILRTPQLAGRLQNVKYEPLQHLASPFADSPYRKKGGNESYDTPPSYYTEWYPG